MNIIVGIYLSFTYSCKHSTNKGFKNYHVFWYVSFYSVIMSFCSESIVSENNGENDAITSKVLLECSHFINEILLLAMCS